MRRTTLFLGWLAVLLLASCGGEKEPPAGEVLDLTAPPDGGAVVPPKVPTAERYAEVAEGPLNLREKPTVDSAVLVQLPVRARVEILSEGRGETIGEDTDRWYEVRTADGKHGYVFGAFLTLDVSAPGEGTPAPPTTLTLSSPTTPIPGDLGAVELLGLSEESETAGRLVEAADYLAAALSLNPENVKGYFHLSDLYFELERYADAATALENYIAREPDSFWGHNNLGLACIRTRNYPRAIAVLERAVQLQREGRPGEAGIQAVRLAYRNLVAAYQANRDSEGAERTRRRMDAL